PVSGYTSSRVQAYPPFPDTIPIETYTITSSAGANGSIAPNGATSVDYDGSQAYVITPAAHYHVADVLVDGVSVGAVTGYTFSSAVGNQPLAASFAIGHPMTTAPARA